MITTMTQFKMPSPVSRQEAKAIFQATAPTYQQVPGLIRKCYIRSEDGYSLGGVYLWESREDAQAMYTEEWYEFVRGKYGCHPVVTFFDTPVVVDNVTREIYSHD